MLQARDIMTKEVITVSPGTRVLDLAHLLAENKINGGAGGGRPGPSGGSGHPKQSHRPG